MIFGDLRDIKTEKHVTEVSLKRKTGSRLCASEAFSYASAERATTGIRFFMRQPQVFLPETASAYFFLAGDIM